MGFGVQGLGIWGLELRALAEGLARQGLWLEVGQVSAFRIQELRASVLGKV